MKPTEIKNVITEILKAEKKKAVLKHYILWDVVALMEHFIQRKHLWKENVQILSQH